MSQIASDNTGDANLRRLSPSSCLSRQGQQYSIQKLIGVLIILCNVSVAMKSEYTRIVANWKTPNVVNIRLERKKSFVQNKVIKDYIKQILHTAIKDQQ